jgi:hypothetical protein
VASGPTAAAAAAAPLSWALIIDERVVVAGTHPYGCHPWPGLPTEYPPPEQAARLGPPDSCRGCTRIRTAPDGREIKHKLSVTVSPW